MTVTDTAGTFLKRTDQLWKLRCVRRILVVAGCLLIAVQVGLLNWGVEWRLGLSAATIAAGVWAVLAIRCPFCRTRLYWRAISERSSHFYDHWLEGLDECPSCGSDGIHPPTNASAPTLAPRRRSVVLAVGVGAVAGLMLEVFVGLLVLLTYESLTGSPKPHGPGPQGLTALLTGSTFGGFCAGIIASRLGAEWRTADAIGLVALLLVFHAALNINGPWVWWFQASMVTACIVPPLLGLRVGSRSTWRRRTSG